MFFFFLDHSQLLESLLRQSQFSLSDQYLLVLDWTFASLTFCENRYFIDNDKQKTLRTVKLKLCAIHISLWKANINILTELWCMANKIYKNKNKIQYVCFKVNRKNIFNLLHGNSKCKSMYWRNGQKIVLKYVFELLFYA